VPFGDVRFFVGHHDRSVMCRLVMCGFFVGHHERSVMCRFTTLVGNVRLRLVPRLIRPTGWLFFCRAS